MKPQITIALVLIAILLVAGAYFLKSSITHPTALVEATPLPTQSPRILEATPVPTPIGATLKSDTDLQKTSKDMDDIEVDSNLDTDMKLNDDVFQ